MTSFVFVCFELPIQHDMQPHKHKRMSTLLNLPLHASRHVLPSEFSTPAGAVVAIARVRGTKMPGILDMSAPTTHRRIELLKARLVPDCKRCLQHALGGRQNVEHYRRWVPTDSLTSRISDVEGEELCHRGNQFRVAVHVLVAVTQPAVVGVQPQRSCAGLVSASFVQCIVQCLTQPKRDRRVVARVQH